MTKSYHISWGMSIRAHLLARWMERVGEEDACWSVRRLGMRHRTSDSASLSATAR